MTRLASCSGQCSASELPLQSCRAGLASGSALWLLQREAQPEAEEERRRRKGRGRRAAPGIQRGPELGREQPWPPIPGSPGGCGPHPVSLPCCHFHRAGEVDPGRLLPGFCPRPPPCCLPDSWLLCGCLFPETDPRHSRVGSSLELCVGTGAPGWPRPSRTELGVLSGAFPMADGVH